jgi:hypothetical protein
MYSSSDSVLTRQTPRLPIFTAGSWPERIKVYTCDTVMLSTSATSAGCKKRGRSATIPPFGYVSVRGDTTGIVPAPHPVGVDPPPVSMRP